MRNTIIQFRKLFCLLLICAVSFKAIEAATAHSYIYLYRGHAYTEAGVGSYYSLPDLNQNNFNDRANSAKFNGVWIFYENPHYNEGQDGVVLWRGEDAIDGQDVLADTELSGKLSSVRNVGGLYPNPWFQSSITFFTGTNFTGMATKKVTTSTAELNFSNATSLIILGKGSWTFYEEIEYNGKAHCVTTTENVNMHPTIEGMNLTLDGIESVEIGCWSKHGVPISLV